MCPKLTNNMTEAEVSQYAQKTLGFYDTEDAAASVGQTTSFNMLGFKSNKKPDGWYFPKDTSAVAIVFEAKGTKNPLDEKLIAKLKEDISIVHQKYKRVIGIAYNGADIRVLRNGEEVSTPNTLQKKEYYLSLFKENRIDTQHIYLLTKRINDCLHTEFGIKNLNHRMIFTACALVAKRYGAIFVKGQNYETFQAAIISTLGKSLENDLKQNLKLDELLKVYREIKMNSTENQTAIDNFIEWVSEISDSINSDYWNGEDVMGIFFNEFNRYKRKSESGQVFTPDHITSFMYRLLEVNKEDNVLDAACGSGAFLVKAMCNMIKEAGGESTIDAENIKSGHLYGIEFDREIFALACANMLIHKDGKTNLRWMDSRSREACDWIRSLSYDPDGKRETNGRLETSYKLKDHHITKVLMNPPFEEKNGCLEIVRNVLDNVPMYTKCAFILPDKKLEKHNGKSLLANHTLRKIIKLPEKLFFEGVTTSIFIFEAGVPQYDKEIFTCYIEDDGLETVKNQGRQDIKEKWQHIEDVWIEMIEKQSGDPSMMWIKPSEHLSYQMPQKIFEIRDEDFVETMMDYIMFQEDIDSQAFKESILTRVLYGSNVISNESQISIVIKENGE